MADLVTDLKDEDIRTQWAAGEPRAQTDDDDATDPPGDDTDDDAGDTDDDSTDA